VCYKTKSRVRE